MELKPFNWTVGCTKDPAQLPEEWYAAKVPGAVQADYAAAKNWPPVEFGAHFKDYEGLEDLYWLYRAPLQFDLTPEQTAAVVFKGIDYQYEIRLDGQVLTAGEGMFTPVRCDVTDYAGGSHTLEVLLWPAPKDRSSGATPGTRDEARRSCKPAACYGWDWHPRLITMGIYDEAGLLIENKTHIERLDASYVLSEDLTDCRVKVEANLTGACQLETALVFAGNTVASDTQNVRPGKVTTCLDVKAPALWNPVGYGQQPMYTLVLTARNEQGDVLHTASRKIGFRRSKLVMNEGSWKEPSKFPKSRSDAPATLEINGRRIFAKGSNWVNAYLYPGAVTEETYKELVTLVKDCNMNILRIWGGGFVNHEVFFDLCDELGIMVWQEFPLACNEYPDDDHYLAVLEQEATSIVRRLRTHPCLVMWCGGNELFNSWSKMTEQHHALRLLDKVCYEEDRFTPYNMTSPLNGMAHGHYFNYDENAKAEFITTVVRSENTAYTEFGCPGSPTAAYLQKYMTPADYADFQPENPVWRGHHAFSAWWKASWMRTPEAEYYFGGYEDMEDLCNKSQFIQAMCYRSMFEEMRKQWPHCSMALNWCFNEPWPCFGNNSLLSWPAETKPAYYSVQQALRPRLASLRVDRHLWKAGEEFTAEVWALNDLPEALPEADIEITYTIGDEAPVRWGRVCIPVTEPQRNAKCGAISFRLPAQKACKFTISLKVAGHPEIDSSYTYLCRPPVTVNTKGMLNV